MAQSNLVMQLSDHKRFGKHKVGKNDYKRMK